MVDAARNEDEASMTNCEVVVVSGDAVRVEPLRMSDDVGVNCFVPVHVVVVSVMSRALTCAYMLTVEPMAEMVVTFSCS